MTSISSLGQSLDQIERLKLSQSTLASLQTQLTTGKKAQLFSGLGTDVIASARSRASIKQLETYDNNIDTANRRIKMMLNAMQNVHKQAESIVGAINVQSQQGDLDISAIGDLANNVIQFVRDMMNEKDGPRYLFGGTDGTAAPLDDSGTLDTFIKTNLDNWVNGTIDTDTLISNYRSTSTLNDTVAGYSASLSSGNSKNVTIRIDEASEVDYTMLGNDPAMRDILVGISMIKNLAGSVDKVSLSDTDPAGTKTAPGADKDEKSANFYKMFNDVAKMLGTAMDRLESKMTNLSNASAQITEVQDDHALQKTALQGIVDDVENADPNEIAVKLNALQTQLEASYRVTALVQGLSLVNFLPI
jgi:flagellar hook-associated protein 3 FlgL